MEEHLIITTINTAFVVFDMVNNPKSPFKNLPFTILSSPMDYTSKNYQFMKTTPKVAKIRDESIKATGQPNCDLHIGHQPYDIKHSDSVRSTKNLIYPQTYENIQDNSLEHLNHVRCHLHMNREKYKYAEI